MNIMGRVPALKPPLARSHRLHPASRAVLLAFALVVLGLLFEQLVTLIVAILMTVLIAIPLSAVATRLERFRIPRAIGALIGLLVGLGALGGILALVIPAFVDEIRSFADQAPAIFDALKTKIAHASGDQPSDVGVQIKHFINGYTNDPARLVGPIATIGKSIVTALTAILLILITAYYMAIRPQPLVDGALRIFPPEHRERAHGVMDRLRGAWIGWMQGVLVGMSVNGFLLWVGLQLIGLQFAVLFAVFSAVLILIPYFGTPLGAIPPVAYGLSESPEKALVVLAIYVGVHAIESYVVIPLVMANRVKLQPAVVAIGVVVIGELFGFIGLFVAVPILSLLVILVEELWVKPMEERRRDEPLADGESAGIVGGKAQKVPSGTQLGVIEAPPDG
jgi:predicted PurR-regulated permease PerM